MPFDNNLTLVNGVVLSTTLHTPPTSTTYPASAPLTRARVIDFGAAHPTASGASGASPEGTGVNGISIALICTTSVSGTDTLVAYIEASDSSSVWTDAVVIGTFEYSTGTTAIASSLVPFHYVIRCQTEMRYIRANLTVTAEDWTTVWVVVGTHHLERL